MPGNGYPRELNRWHSPDKGGCRRTATALMAVVIAVVVGVAMLII
jgi:hypothetical protein